MRFRRFTFLLSIAVAVLASAGLVQSQTISYETAVLSGLNENPPVVSPGSGLFQIHLESDAAQYVLNYSGLMTVTQVHIHLGNPGTNGPPIAFLCSNLPNAPTTVACSNDGSAVTGTLTSADVLSAMDGDRVLLSAGDFEGFKQALAGGATYVNVHTEAHPSGELRGQVNERPR